jgi:hypothetical protein
MRTSTKTLAKRATMVPAILAALAASLAAAPAQAQAIICCNQSIPAEGGWIGSNRVEDCQGYFDSAPTDILRALCKHRSLLICINTSRCTMLPPEPPDQDQKSDLDRDGLEEGFYGPPPPEPSRPPAAPPPMPRRLVYLMQWPGDGKPVRSFTVWLDGKACPLALDQNNRLADSSAAKHVVRGKVIRGGGRVKIEAEAQQRPGGAKLGPFSGEAEGEDAAAVAKATRAVMEKMKLVCAR